MKHHAITIGATGDKRIYIDVPLDVAKARYQRDVKMLFGTVENQPVYEFDFEDEFCVYDASETDDAWLAVHAKGKRWDHL